jgi:hypothetical protein
MIHQNFWLERKDPSFSLIPLLSQHLLLVHEPWADVGADHEVEQSPERGMAQFMYGMHKRH